MPVQKKPLANNKPKQSKKPQIAKPVEEETVDAMEAAVITGLVASGVPYLEAKAQVMGGQQPQPEMVVEEPEPPVIPQKSNDFSDSQVKLFEMLKNIEDQPSYDVDLEVPSYLMDWVVRRTLQEAYVRNNPEFLVEDFLILLLKEQRAIDPTKGGAASGGSTGPKDLYNPVTGKWS